MRREDGQMLKNGLRGTTAILLAGLLTACGGSAPSLQERDQPLEVAPTWMAELDLPGCDCALGDRVDRLLIHPFDDQLVIGVVDGSAGCVDARPVPERRDTSSGRPGLSLGLGGGISPVETVAGDDPVPIKPDDSREGASSGERGDEDTGDSGSDEGPPTPGDTIKLGVGGDDPVPIRPNTIIPVHLGYSQD